jgi:homoserine dehydrogenase
MDVEGVDTALKAMILSQSLMNADVPDISEIEIKGISDIDPDLFVKARKNSERIRLVARSNIIKGKNSISVSPVSLSRDHPLYNLPGAVNGLVLSTDILGNVSLTGKGAGSRETGFALLKDLIDLSFRDRRTAETENCLSGRVL